MSADLLIADSSTNADRGVIQTREDGWAFLKGIAKDQLKFRINLTDESGEAFEYHGFQPILQNMQIQELMEAQQQYERFLPNLSTLINMVFSEINNAESHCDENIVEDLFTFVKEENPLEAGYNPDDEIENVYLEDLLVDEGYRDVELDDMVDIIHDIGRNLFDYILFALFNFEVVGEHTWEFLHCTKAHIDTEKLYITVRISEEALKDLDFMDERTDIDFVEIANEIKRLFNFSVRSKHDREERRRSRDRGSNALLVS